MPASSDIPRFLNDASPVLSSQQALTSREAEARLLLTRALLQLSKWQWKYGRNDPSWLPPAGDIELQLDIDDWMDA